MTKPDPKDQSVVRFRQEIVNRIQNGLEAEAIVDLWNVVFPRNRNFWCDEEDQTIRYNEEVLGYVN